MKPSSKTSFRRHSPWRRVAMPASLSLWLSVVPFAINAQAEVVVDPPPPAGVPDSGHSAPLVGLAYSPDGALLYTLDTLGELRGREIQSGRTVFHDNAGKTVSEIRALPDGSLLIGRFYGVVTWHDAPVPGQPLKLRGEFKGEEVERQLQAAQEKDTLSPFYSLQLGDIQPSPDNSLLAVVTQETAWEEGDKPVRAGAKSARVRIWNTANKAIIRAWDPIPVSDGMLHLAWDNDGKTLVVALPDVALQRFDIQTGALQSEWRPPSEAATRPDSAANRAEMDRRLQTLPPGVRERAQQAMEKERAAEAANPPPQVAADFGKTQAISRDGKFLVAATRNGWQLWDTESNTNRILEASQRLPAGDEAAFSADGSLVATRSSGRFWLWRTDGTQIGWANVAFVKFAGLDFSPEGNNIALADDSGIARQWSVETPLTKTANVVFPGYFEAWRLFSVAPNSMLVSTAHNVAMLDAPGRLQWFSNEPIAAPVEMPDYAKTQVRSGIIGLATAPDGKSWAESVSYGSYPSTFVNLGIPRGELRVRDATTGAILWRQADTNYSRTVNNLWFLPDGTLLTGKESPGGVSAGPRDYSFAGLQARDGRSGEQTGLDIAWGDKVGLRRPGSVSILKVSRDGKRMVISSGSGGNGIQVVDLEAKQVLQFFGAQTQIDPGAWALSPDGRWLARAGRFRAGIAAIDLWDLDQPRPNSGMAPTVRVNLDSSARALSFAPDNSLAAGLSDGRVMVWAPSPADNATPLWETRPGRAIEALEFSFDGKTIWSGDERGDLSTRDAQTGQWLSTLRLLAPKSEEAAPSWVLWTRGGDIVSGP